jgi:hypothetical protein
VLITGNAHYVFTTTCKMLAERLDVFVQWPTREMIPAAAQGFNFPGTIGRNCYSIFFFSI